MLQAGPYQGLWRKLVLRFKEAGDAALAEVLVDYLATLSQTHLPVPDRVAAVPTSRRGWRWRGYGAPEQLARGLAIRLNCPQVQGFACPGDPRPQKRLNFSQRRHSPLRFECTAPVQGSILLVDDVVTSGATLAAARQALLRAGAREVWPVVLAGARSGEPSRRREASRKARRATNSAR